MYVCMCVCVCVCVKCVKFPKVEATNSQILKDLVDERDRLTTILMVSNNVVALNNLGKLERQVAV